MPKFSETPRVARRPIGVSRRLATNSSFCIFWFLWMSPSEPTLDHRSISQWKTHIPRIPVSQRICIEIHCICECHQPNSMSGSPIYFPVKNPISSSVVLLVPVQGTGLKVVHVGTVVQYLRRCIRITTVGIPSTVPVRIHMKMYVWAARSCADRKIHWNNSGGMCASEISSVRWKTRIHGGFSVVFYWFLSTGDAVFLSDFSGVYYSTHIMPQYAEGCTLFHIMPE